MNPVFVRFGILALVFLLMAACEMFRPRRPLVGGRIGRWPSNLAVILIGNFLVLLMPLVPVSAALLADARGWGLLNLVPVSYPLRLVAGVLFLDLIIYWQHRVFHRFTFLWRVHLMHHVDSDVDVTTALRFHPIEIILSSLWKIAAVIAFGAPALSVMIFEVVLSSAAMFNHGNLKLPAAVDAVLRTFLITPDVHRIHHSTKRKEVNSNYGFFLSWWDRLFRSYTARPQLGHDAMRIGVAGYGDAKYLRIDHMLAVPFLRQGAGSGEEQPPLLR